MNPAMHGYIRNPVVNRDCHHAKHNRRTSNSDDNAAKIIVTWI